MTTLLGLRSDLALDPDSVLRLLGDHVASSVGFTPTWCSARLVKQSRRTLVARYELGADETDVAIVGKWFATDRGEVVAKALADLRSLGFGGPAFAVPAPIVYVPEVRALFVEAVDGILLREALRTGVTAAAHAGAWLAAFHRSGVQISRACGPAKQRRAVWRWSAEFPPLKEFAPALDDELAALEDPMLPVHYDFYHSQAILSSGGCVVLDLDESGMGDPGFDLAHFRAHLALLALQWFQDPAAFDDAARAFREGYGSGWFDPPPALAAFAWLKLARQAYQRNASYTELKFVMGRLKEELRAA
jgi:hypothetical protein